MGPAVLHDPTRSQTCRLVVETLGVSVPVATLVVSVKLASVAFASPDPPSPAVQAMATSLPCQAPSAAPHETVGAFLSTLLPAIGPAVAQAPTLSQTCRLFVEALGVSVPAPTAVVRLKPASAAFANPDPLSLAVQAIATSLLCHALSAAPHETVGAFLSTLLPASGPIVVHVPPPLQILRLFVAALVVSVPLGTFVVRVKAASAAFANPDWGSVAVQAMVTSVLCQTPSTAPHDTCGGVGSKEYTSALLTGPSPPLTSTRPSASPVALWFTRSALIELVTDQVPGTGS
jgi:hypothetical protein